MTRSYRSDALAAIHETASDLHEAGVLDKRTLRSFDELCLTPARAMMPADLRALRARARQPGGVRSLSERDRRAHQPVGAGREAPGRRFAQAP
jgi:hypothetical protein